MFCRRDAQAGQVPGTDGGVLVRPSWLATPLAPPTRPSPSMNPEPGQVRGLTIWTEAGPFNSPHPSLGPGPSNSLRSHLGHSLQGPITSSRKAVLVATQIQGLQPRTHGAEGGEGGEGTVGQGSGRPGWGCDGL